MTQAIDWEQIQEDFMALRDDNAVSIAIRRGSTTLAAQTVRVEKAGSQAQRGTNPGSEASTARVVVLGDVDLNIQVEDRFTLSGQLYVVTFVHPNRQACTQADVRLEE